MYALRTNTETQYLNNCRLLNSYAKKDTHRTTFPHSGLDAYFPPKWRTFVLLSSDQQAPESADHQNGQQQQRHRQRLQQTGRIAAVLAVARAVLHEYVERAGAHQTEALIALDARFTHERTAAEVAPLAVHCAKLESMVLYWDALTRRVLIFRVHRKHVPF